MVADMVFRPVRSPADVARARRLLGAGEPGPDEIWSGLWNLTAADGDVLAAIAATRQLSLRVVEIRAVRTFQGYAVRARLLRELADACRARGVEWLVADAGTAEPDVLRHAGFVPMTHPELPAPRAAGWLARQL